jgi:protein TonB
MPPPVAINMIRIKHEETPIKKKEAPKPPPAENKAEKKIYRDLFKTPAAPKLKLPFEINPNLPQAPGIVPTLLMEKYAPDAPEAYEVGDIDRPITVLTQTPPLYPMHARRMGIEGWVEVKLLVSEEGFVQNVEVVTSEPQGVFEESVMQSLSSWKFSPGTIRGVAVKTYVTTTIRFNLKDE